MEEIFITNSDGKMSKIIRDKKLSDYDISKGDYLQTMLRRGDEYKELIIKII